MAGKAASAVGKGTIAAVPIAGKAAVAVVRFPIRSAARLLRRGRTQATLSDAVDDEDDDELAPITTTTGSKMPHGAMGEFYEDMSAQHATPSMPIAFCMPASLERCM